MGVMGAVVSEVVTWVAAVVLAASPVDLGGSWGIALGIHSLYNRIQSHNRRTQNQVHHRRKIRPQDRCTCQHREVVVARAAKLVERVASREVQA